MNQTALLGGKRGGTHSDRNEDQSPNLTASSLYVYSEKGSMGFLDWALEGLIMMFIWFGVVAFFKKQ